MGCCAQRERLAAARCLPHNPPLPLGCGHAPSCARLLGTFKTTTVPVAIGECKIFATAPPPAAAYEKGGQLEKALAAFQQQLRDGVEPDLITYSSLISACERAGAWGGRAAVWCKRVCGCLVKEGVWRRLLLGELRGWGMG